MKIASLFCGAGGLDFGLTQVGHEIEWANDIDKDAIETYRINIGDHAVLDSIEHIESHSIPRVDAVIGGFPCQGFSVANTSRHVDDHRNLLYKQLLRIIREKTPKLFLAENVKGLLTLGHGAVLQKILSDFASLGYRISYRLLNAADFGVPQRRERIIIVGVRKDIPIDFFFPMPTHTEPSRSELTGLAPWVSVGQALAAIPEPGVDSKLSNHTGSKYKLRFNGFIGHRYVDPNRPAPTVTARGDNKGGVVVLHHPNNHRRMTVRELATVQSFPLTFFFTGTPSTNYRLIGNAVPPKLGEALGRAIKQFEDDLAGVRT